MFSQRDESVDETVEVGERKFGGEGETEQNRSRLSAHRGQIAEIDGQRPMTDGVRWCEASIEMHALDDRIDREHFDLISDRLDDGRVVADAYQDPAWRGRQPRGDAADEFLLGEIGNGHFA